MPTRSQILATARALEGIGETPPGSNRNKITAAYGLVGAWCAMTTWYVWHLNGVDLRKLFTSEWASTVQGANAAKTRGLWRAGLSGAEPGDLVYYQVPGGDLGYVNHTGLYVSAAAGVCTSIDGNWNNKLQQVDHDRRHVVGHIDMSQYVTPPPKPTAPGAPPFPGRDKFGPGKANGYVTMLGHQLVHRGYGRHYTVGPGPRWTEADRQNTEEFQRAQGWHGSDADGYPGPETWSRLFAK